MRINFSKKIDFKFRDMKDTKKHEKYALKQ